MSLAILFHFLCVQHVSDINISIIRSLRLFCWITTLVCCSWFVVCWRFGAAECEWCPCCRLKLATRTLPKSNRTKSPTQHRTKNNTTNVVIQQNSRKLLMMDILMSETCWAHKKWNKTASDIKLVFYSSTNSKRSLPKWMLTHTLIHPATNIPTLGPIQPLIWRIKVDISPSLMRTERDTDEWTPWVT